MQTQSKPFLNLDILQLIISCSPLSTLHSCLQVSKTFADLTIPVLYKNPWTFNKCQNKKFWPNITKTIVTSLPSDVFQLLFSKANIKINPCPIYNYSLYCRHVTKSSVEHMSDELMINCKRMEKENFNKISFQYEFYLMFFLNSKKIQLLEISISNLFSEHAFLQRHQKENNNFSDNINSLRVLECYAYLDSINFATLSNYCKNIEHLIINSYDIDNKGIAILVSKQRMLKYLELKRSGYLYNCYINKYKLLSDSLMVQFQNRRFVESIYFKEFICINEKCMQFLSRNSLKKLRVKFSTAGASLDVFKMLSNIKFELLEEIEINSFTRVHEASKMIINLVSNCSIKLKRIYWNILYFNEKNIHFLRDYLQIIITNCYNIEYLTIWYFSSNNPSLFNDYLQLLTACRHLRGLRIQLQGYCTFEFFKNLLEFSIKYSSFNFEFFDIHVENITFETNLFNMDVKSFKCLKKNRILICIYNYLDYRSEELIFSLLL